MVAAFHGGIIHDSVERQGIARRFKAQHRTSVDPIRFEHLPKACTIESDRCLADGGEVSEAKAIWKGTHGCVECGGRARRVEVVNTSGFQMRLDQIQKLD